MWVSGEKRKMHNEELHDLCSSPNISVSKSKRMRCLQHVARTGDTRLAINNFVRRSEEKRTFERPRCRWEKILKWTIGTTIM
jgi:hypothetical protein